MGHLYSPFRPTPEIARRYHQRFAVESAVRRPVAPMGALLSASLTATPGDTPAAGTPSPSAGRNDPPGLHRTLFDRFGELLGRYPQCVTVPALFMIEFGAAMPLVNAGWGRLFGVEQESQWRSLEQLGWSLPIALTLPFILFGAQALPKGAYDRIKASTLAPWEARNRARDTAQPRHSKRGRRRPPRGELAQTFIDGGMAFGVNPYCRRHYGPTRGFWNGLGAELIKSAALYGATGAVLGLPLEYFVPPATALSVGANLGGTYVAQIWGSLGVPAGRILAAFTCLFFTSHAISGLEAIAQQSDDIPDGIGYLGQLLIGAGLSAFFIHKAKKDAAQLAPTPLASVSVPT